MDQAAALRSMVKGTPGRARVVAFASGKGGVGKSQLCANLAVVLARLGKKVAIVDVDIGLGNADLALGVRPKYNLRNVLLGQVSVTDALTPTESGVLLLAGSTGVSTVSDLDETQRGYLISCFDTMTAGLDFVFLDCGAGITRNVIRFAAAADEVIVIATPEPAGITDPYALIKTVSREKGLGRIRLVCNLAKDRNEATKVASRIRTVARRFLDLEVENLGGVLADPYVRRAAYARRPFVLEYPNCRASECVRTLAQRLLAGVRTAKGGAERREGRGGLSFVERFLSLTRGG